MTAIQVAAGVGAATTASRWRGVARRVLPWAAVALLIGELVWAWPFIVTAVGTLPQASATALVVALLAEAGSVVAFAATTSAALRATGGTVRLTAAVATTVAAGAVHNLLPGGNVFATAFTFSRLRRWGASTAAATWCLAISGLVCSASLALIAGVGLLAGSTSDAQSQLISAAVSVLAVIAIAAIARHPGRLQRIAECLMRGWNRLTRSPADRGLAWLQRTAVDLTSVRPTVADWGRMGGASLANWTFDLAAFVACLWAFGASVPLSAMLLVYVAGMAASSLSPLPGGIGVVEAAMIVSLTATGLAAPLAVGAVLSYRLIALGGITIAGGVVLGHERLRAAAR